MRRLLRAVVATVLLFVGASFAAVLLFRVVDPPVTMVMVLEPGPVSAIDHRWVGQPAIAAHAARAVIAAEDQRFLSHHGIDFDALATAVEDYRRGDELRGASSLTQQVAKNLFLWHERSFLRKGLEAWLALVIDLSWPKQRILEVYLNVAEFGPDVFGVEAAALHFFGVPAARLTAEQSALLAAVLPSPKRMNAGSPSAYVESRQREILEQVSLLEERGHYRGLDW